MSVEEKDEIEDFEGEESLNIDSISDDEQVYPLEKIRIEKGRMSLFEIKRRVERKDIQLDPNFQRQSVWNDKQKSELIESILMGIPIPVFYFFESKDAKIQIIDGRQRITTAIEFMNDEFKLGKLNIIKVSGRKFSDLDALWQRKIEDYQIDTYIIQPPTPEKIKFDIFDRVNRGGTRLNNQEMRNALYQGNATELIDELSKLDIFKKATGHSIESKRMKDRYIILRFIGFFLYRYHVLPQAIQYQGNIDEFLAQVMTFLNELNGYNEELIADIRLAFTKSMSFAHKNYGADIFRFKNLNGENKRPINMALFESLAYLFVLCCDKNKIPSKESIEKLKSNFDNPDKFIKGVDSTANVKYRFDEVEKFLEEKV